MTINPAPPGFEMQVNIARFPNIIRGALPDRTRQLDRRSSLFQFSRNSPRNLGMEKDAERRTIRGFVQWATTPPQAYLMYLIALVLVGGMSFYAGMLKPNKKSLVPPQSISQPAPPSHN
jgi:hypothetical protein